MDRFRGEATRVVGRYDTKVLEAARNQSSSSSLDRTGSSMSHGEETGAPPVEYKIQRDKREGRGDSSRRPVVVAWSKGPGLLVSMSKSNGEAAPTRERLARPIEAPETASSILQRRPGDAKRAPKDPFYRSPAPTSWPAKRSATSRPTRETSRVEHLEPPLP
ncbi:hypothetical protein KM043_001065 [Ampulex compressa]|nr:hypothetical protein KM043_001065 [Ampulex compressa]